MQPPEFAFGPFHFDADAQVLYRAGEIVRLGGRGARLLAILLTRRGSVLSKSELMDAAWPDVTVEENNLAAQIVHLRRQLGKHPGGGEWITTVSGVGYRFLPEPPGAERQPRLGPPAVAVLPFETTGNSAEADLFVEDLTSALSQFRSIAVTARRSTLQFRATHRDIRQVARELGVRYAVEGRMHPQDGHRRITVQLVEAETGTHLWSQRFEAAGTADDLLPAQMAAAIEVQIHLAEIARARRVAPETAEAYALYLQARSKLLSSRPGDNALAYGLIVRALELEPDNVTFLAAAAEVFHHRTAVGWGPLTADDRRLALDIIDRGMDAVGTDAVSLALLSNAMLSCGEEELGLATARRAVDLQPAAPLVFICAGLANVWAGDLAEGRALFEQSLALNPTDPAQRFALNGLGTISCIEEKFEESLQWARRTHAVSQGLSGGHWRLIAATAHLGRIDEARRYLQRYRTVSPQVTIASIEHGQPFGSRDRLRTLTAGLRLAGMT